MKFKLQKEDDIFSFVHYPDVKEKYLDLRAKWYYNGWTNRDSRDQRFGQDLINGLCLDETHKRFVTLPTLYYEESFEKCCQFIEYFLFGIEPCEGMTND